MSINLTFRALTLRQIRSDEGLTLETPALYSLRWPIYIFNLVDVTKFLIQMFITNKLSLQRQTKGVGQYMTRQTLWDLMFCSPAI